MEPTSGEAIKFPESFEKEISIESKKDEIPVNDVRNPTTILLDTTGKVRDAYRLWKGLNLNKETFKYSPTRERSISIRSESSRITPPSSPISPLASLDKHSVNLISFTQSFSSKPIEKKFTEKHKELSYKKDEILKKILTSGLKDYELGIIGDLDGLEHDFGDKEIRDNIMMTFVVKKVLDSKVALESGERFLEVMSAMWKTEGRYESFKTFLTAVLDYKSLKDRGGDKENLEFRAKDIRDKLLKAYTEVALDVDSTVYLSLLQTISGESLKILKNKQ
jgi:hypothetical protein